jgi:hypothetical protein
MFMKKIYGLIALCFLTISCSNAPVAADGYTFYGKQYTKNTVQINIVTYANQQQLTEALRRRGRNSDIPIEKVKAFSDLYPPNYNQCTIHMVDPTSAYNPEYVGHEFLHCVYGQWHRDNQTH